jgi:hypothetical protein
VAVNRRGTSTIDPTVRCIIYGVQGLISWGRLRMGLGRRIVPCRTLARERALGRVVEISCAIVEEIGFYDSEGEE